MAAKNLVEVLSCLAKGERRSEMARLRDVFPQIEMTLQAGARRADVLNALHEHGFRMTSLSFQSALHRLRKERCKSPRQGPRSLRIAGADVVSPARYSHNPTPENDLLK